MKIVVLAGKAGAGKDTAAKYLVDNHGCIKVSLADPMKRFCMKVFGFTRAQLWGESADRNKHDRRYNNYSDERIYSDKAWNLASSRLDEYGEDFIDDVFGIGTSCNPEYMRSLLHWFEWLGENHPKLTPRIALQTLGTEWGRCIDVDVWVKYLVKTSRIVLRGDKWYSGPTGLTHMPKDKDVPRGVVVADARFLNEISVLKGVRACVVRIDRDTDNGIVGLENHQSELEIDTIQHDQFDMVISNNEGVSHLYAALDILPILLPKRDV